MKVVDEKDKIGLLLDDLRGLDAENAACLKASLESLMVLLLLCRDQAEVTDSQSSTQRWPDPMFLFSGLMELGLSFETLPAPGVLFERWFGEAPTVHDDVRERVIRSWVPLGKDLVGCWLAVRAFAETWKLHESGELDSASFERRCEEIFAVLGLGYSLGPGLRSGPEGGTTQGVAELFVWSHCGDRVQTELKRRQEWSGEVACEEQALSHFAHNSLVFGESESWGGLTCIQQASLGCATDDTGLVEETVEELVRSEGIKGARQDFARTFERQLCFHKKAVVRHMQDTRVFVFEDGESITNRTFQRYESEVGKISDLNEVGKIYEQKKRNQRQQPKAGTISQTGLRKAGLGSAASIKKWVQKAHGDGMIAGEVEAGRDYTRSEVEAIIEAMSPATKARKQEQIAAILARL